MESLAWMRNIKVNLRQIGCEDVNWLRIGFICGPFDHSSKSSGFIAIGNFLSSKSCARLLFPLQPKQFNKKRLLHCIGGTPNCCYKSSNITKGSLNDV